MHGVLVGVRLSSTIGADHGARPNDDHADNDVGLGGERRSLEVTRVSIQLRARSRGAEGGARAAQRARKALTSVAMDVKASGSSVPSVLATCAAMWRSSALARCAHIAAVFWWIMPAKYAPRFAKASSTWAPALQVATPKKPGVAAPADVARNDMAPRWALRHRQGSQVGVPTELPPN